MRKLDVSIEINGHQVPAGTISGTSSEDACFAYAPDYLNDASSAPVSVSLPLQKEPFTAFQTKNYFEGLLPEGFTRKSVAQWIRADENDYLSLLSGLGQECLGAIRITEGEVRIDETDYEKLTEDQLIDLAREGASAAVQLVTEAHLSLAGASGKAGLYFDRESGEWFLPKGDAPSTHIVKQSHVRLDSIVTNEQLSMLTAREAGLNVPDSFIISFRESREEDVLLASKRFDRLFGEDPVMVKGLACPYRLHQEDFAQALGIPAAEKYEAGPEHAYLERMFSLLRQYSANPIEDQLGLWDMIIFDFLIGNADNHVKNFSLLYDETLKKIRLAPAYDIISTCIYSNSSKNMGLGINGVYDVTKISRSDFAGAASRVGLGEKIAMKHFDKMADGFEKALERASEALEGHGFVKAGEIRTRILENCGYRNL